MAKKEIKTTPEDTSSADPSVCANCNQKYINDGVKLCPQCRQV